MSTTVHDQVSADLVSADPATAAPAAADPATTVPAPAGPPTTSSAPEPVRDAHHDVLLAVQRALAANWKDERPRIAVVERGGIATVYVSTVRTLDPAIRSDVRGAVRAALAPYVSLAPYTNVVFLWRGGT